MKLIYATDLHGDINKYEKLLEVAINCDIKLIVNGGDMLPKNNDRHKSQPLFINEYLRSYFKRLEKQGITYISMLGNDDLLSVDKLFSEVCSEFDNVYDIARCKVIINGYEFIGMNYILDHPFSCKDRVVMEKDYVHQRQLSSVALISNETGYHKIYHWIEYSKTELPHMCDILDKLFLKPINKDRAIYIMHMPPARLRLGQLLYENLDIGSIDIYEFLKDVQPLLSLHGHIHESPDTLNGKWINKIANTTCIQPGQTELYDDNLVYAEIDLVNKKYKRMLIRAK